MANKEIKNGNAHELHYSCEQQETKGNSTLPCSLHFCLTQVSQAKTTIYRSSNL